MPISDQIKVEDNSSEKKEEKLVKSFRLINIFTEEELEKIAKASKDGKNFPIDNWFRITSIKSRALYFDCIKYFDDYHAWQNSGRKGNEPQLPVIFLTTTPSDFPSASNNDIEATPTIPFREKTKEKDEPRPISIVPPLPFFSESLVKRNGSTLSNSSTKSCGSQQSNFSAHSRVDHYNGRNNHIENNFVLYNIKSFPQEPTTKGVSAKVSSAPTTPVIPRKKINFIKWNAQNVGKSPTKKTNATKGEAITLATLSASPFMK